MINPITGKVKMPLIDATDSTIFCQRLRKNLGKKNCELTDDHINTITKLFLDFKETPESMIFDNDDFGYSLITIEQPLRLTTHITPERLIKFKETVEPRLHPLADALFSLFGSTPQKDFNEVRSSLAKYVTQNFFNLKRDDFKILFAASQKKMKLRLRLLVNKQMRRLPTKQIWSYVRPKRFLKKKTLKITLLGSFTLCT